MARALIEPAKNPSPPDRPRRQPLRWLLWALVGCLALLLTTLGGALALLQTDFARERVAGLLESILSSPTQPVQVEGLSGFLPFDIRLRRFVMADAAGPWLTVEDARIALRLADLLNLRLTIETVGAERVRLDRLPPAPPEPVSDEPFALPELPSIPERLPLPLPVSIERVAIGSIELGQPILGEATIFGLDGRASADAEAAHLALALVRRDAPTARADLELDADLAAQTLVLDLTASETGGLLRGVAGDDRVGDLTLRLNGEGPLADWRARLDLAAAGLVDAEAELGLGLVGLPKVDFVGRVRPAPALLPAEISPLVGEAVELDLALHPTGARALRLERLRVATATATLAGAGHADLAADTVDLRFDVAVPDLAPAGGLVGAPIAGSAGLALTARGALRRPQLRALFDASGLHYDRLSLETTKLDAQIQLSQPFEAGFPGGALEAKGRIDGIELAGRPAPGLTNFSLDLAVLAPPQGAIELQRLSLDGGVITARATGGFDPATLAGHAHAEVDSPALGALLASLAPLVPGLPPIDGSTRLVADAVSAEQAATVDLTLAVRTQNLAGLPAGADPVLGPSPSLDLAARLQDRQHLEVGGVTLRGRAVELDGKGAFGLSDRSITGDVEFRLPDLAAFEGLAGQRLGGRAEAGLKAGGSLEAPSVDLTLRAADVAVAGQVFRAITLDADAGGSLQDLAGRVRFVASEARGDIDLATRYQLLQQRRLELTELILTGPGTRLGGALTVALDPLLATGRLDGRIGDLAPLAALGGQRLTGSIELEASLTALEQRQAAAVTLRARNIAGDFGRLASADLTARGSDLLGAPDLDITLDAAGFSQPAVSVERLRATVRGRLEALAVTLALAGRQAATPFDLDAGAGVAAAGQTRRVTLERLRGSYAGQPLSIGGPATLGQEPARIDLSGLDLRLGRARLTGRARYGGGRVDGVFDLASTPLEAFAALGAPELAGRAEASLRLSGSTGSPEIRFEARGRGIVPKAATGMRVPPADLDLAATLSGGALQFTAGLAGITEQPLTAEARLPVALSLEPVNFGIRRDRPLSGRVRGRTELAPIGHILALDGQRIAGRLDIDLAMAGTLERPTATGSLTLAEGQVEDAITGVILRDMALRIVGDQSRLVVERLAARDPAGGTVTGQGQMRLDGTTPSDFRITLAIRELRALRNRFGTAQVSGDLAFAGDLRRSRVEGTVTIDRADLVIPDIGASAPPTIPVRIAGAPLPDAESSSAAAPMRIELAIAVEAPARIFVRGRGLESEWGGSLRVEGTADSPRILGRINVRRGFMDILDRRFVLDRGDIDFDGRQPPLPTLNIVTSAEGYQIKAIVTLDGPADDLRLTLSSEPIYPQDEIISRLLFNRGTAQITPAQGLRVAAAVQQLQSGGEGLLGSVRRSLGVDSLEVGGSSADDANVSVGKYINDRVYLQLQQGLTPETSKAQVQIEITPNLSARSEINQNAQPGFSLEWSYDY